MSGRLVAWVLDRVAVIYGLPEVIRVDNGPEITSKALNKWAYENGVNSTS